MSLKEIILNINRNENANILSPKNTIWIIISICLITTVVAFLLFLFYQRHLKTLKKDSVPSAIEIVMQEMVEKVDNFFAHNIDKKYGKILSVYFTQLFFFIFTNVIIALLPTYDFFKQLLPIPVSDYRVSITLASISFILLNFFAIRKQKWSFLKKYINPLNLVLQFVPLFSLTVRLFIVISIGVVFADIINSILKLNQPNGINITLYLLISPFVRLIFDFVGTFTQAAVFTGLSIMYITIEIEK